MDLPATLAAIAPGPTWADATWPEIGRRLLLIAAVAIAAHVTVVVIRRLAGWVPRARFGQRAKVHTLTGFLSSAAIFALYFVSIGFGLRELGVPLTAYFATASVIGLAVSFGSQGVVQDVISSMTLIVADVLDVGDMVDVGGQVGVVRRIGIRYTILTNFAGADVYIPNRNVMNVINFRSGFVRAYLDARLPGGGVGEEAARDRIAAIVDRLFRQFSGVMFLPPTVGVESGRLGRIIRVKFRIWPGQGGIIESAVRAEVLQELKNMDETYQDWMVLVHYRAETSEGAGRLPRPAAVERRIRAAAARREIESERAGPT